MTNILELRNVTKQFGGLVAVNDVTTDIEEGSIVGLIGPNGAGKTTLFNMIANYFHPTSGTIHYKGNDITNVKVDKMAKLGIARTFQVTRPFGDMSIIDNIMVGGYLGTNNTKDVRKKAEEIYEYVAMTCNPLQVASEVTTVDRKKLEVGRALATAPDLLLLDEVMAGCNPQEKLELVECARKIRESGVTIIIIEHDIKTIMSCSDKIIMLDRGSKLVEGLPQEVGNDPRAISAYLGEDYVHVEG
ncbi:MAG: ABC transporter ATP-binding protein [Clostridiales Family XIII bacterium]|nr:ABC transporter ATP-binding protein [Clostridiales Family XIII bacterium]